jgi:hypothetical protein
MAFVFHNEKKYADPQVYIGGKNFLFLVRALFAFKISHFCDEMDFMVRALKCFLR